MNHAFVQSMYPMKRKVEKARYREVLVFVAGTTPQIVTETIYALGRKDPPIYPDEIKIVTTAVGRKRIEETLVQGKILAGFAKEYGLPVLDLTDRAFVIVNDSGGKPMDDIRSEAENEVLGDTITSLIRDLSKDAGSRLHCSIAGGRKTMSFYLGAALQLFGRSWDKLYHVLVTPEFESHPDFFYKPKKDVTLEVRLPDGGKRRVSTKEARIELAELPFVRLSGRLSLPESNFRDLVSAGQREIDTATLQPTLHLNLHDRTILVGSALVELIPVQIMIYVTFARAKHDHCPHPERVYCHECRDCFKVLSEFGKKEMLEAMAGDYETIYRGSKIRAQEFLAKWHKGYAPDLVRQNISKINRSIREQLSDEALTSFCTITNVKQYGITRYGFRVEKGKIRIE
jgi:CRISPR-associated protein (TIGR02584 family)